MTSEGGFPTGEGPSPGATAGAMRRIAEDPARPSHLRSLARFLVARARASRSPERSPKAQVPQVEARRLAARPRRVRRFLRVTEGMRIAALVTGEVLPPTYAATWETAYFLDLLRLGGYPLPRRGLVHLGGERVWIRPLAGGGRIDLTLRLAHAQPGRGGTRATITSRIRNGAGQPCVESETYLLLRGIGDGRGTDTGSRPSPPPPLPEPDWRELTGWSLGGSHGRRYALVSGDVNPIHLSRLGARLFGFERPILQGFCTEAMIAHALIEHLLGGEPRALRKLAIRFAAPLALPASTLLQVTATGGAGRFRLLAAERGPTPYAEGAWVAAVEADQG
jgi:acyl dehydratase